MARENSFSAKTQGSEGNKGGIAMSNRGKKILALGVAAAMAFSMAACGSTSDTSQSSDTSASTDTSSTSTDTSASTDTSSADEGKVLNICVWNNEFPNRMKDHYPGFEAADPEDSTKGGKIGDVTVNFIVTDNQGGQYQTKLDEKLGAQDSAAADDKVDMFLVEADYARKYVDADANVAMPLEDLGITADDLSKQYKYTQDIVSDANGKIRGTSWQACSAGLIYNRAIAKQVLGSDDPTAVQEAVKDWATFNETAEKMKAANYKMTSTVGDTFRVYSNNISGPWVQDGKIVVDPNCKQWVDDSKKLVDEGLTTTNDLWTDEWKAGFQAPGDVFCYFGPAWLINFSMGNDPSKEDDGSIAHAGGWGLCNGPQGYYWGGSWICAAVGTDNASLVKDIMLKMTTDNDVMKSIATADSDCVNNKEVLAELASSDEGNNAVLGGQNPYQQLADGAEKVDMSNTTQYDQACVEDFQSSMMNYFNGNATYDEALQQFYKSVMEKHPELTPAE